MKPLISILILVSFISWPGIISGGGSPEGRRRAATVSALRHHVLPPQLLRLIASNGHVTRDCEEPEMGFFPQNEWKALKRVFKCSERTTAIRHVIGLYDNAREAWENAPNWDDHDRDGQFRWWKEELEDGNLCIIILSRPGGVTQMKLNENCEIISLTLPVLNGKEIGDLSYLPPNLRSLVVSHLNNFEFSKLPKGLKLLVHPGPDAESKLHVQSLPPGLNTFRLRQIGHRRKEDPLEVHFNLPLPQGLKIYVPRMDGLVFHPEPAEIKEMGAEFLLFRRWEMKWDDGSQIQVIVH